MKGDKTTVRAFLGPAFDVSHVVIETEVECLGCHRRWIAMRECTPCGCDAKLKSIAEHVRFIATIKPRRRRPPVVYGHGCSKKHDPGMRCKHGRCCFDCIVSTCLTVGAVVTAQILTAGQIAEVREEVARGRQNAWTRAIRSDCDGAIQGSYACKESVASAWNRLHAQGRVG